MRFLFFIRKHGIKSENKFSDTELSLKPNSQKGVDL